MRKIACLIVAVCLAACGSSGDGNGGTNFSPDSCSNSDQKRFVRDFMFDVYLWNDLLPNQVSVGDYDTPEELLAFLTTFSPTGSDGQPID